MSYQLYRATTLGTTLQETLDEMIQSGHITPELANVVLRKYDKSVTNALHGQVRGKINFTAGRLETYRCCDQAWTMMLKDVEFRQGQKVLQVDAVKVLACPRKGGLKRRKSC